MILIKSPMAIKGYNNKLLLFNKLITPVTTD